MKYSILIILLLIGINSCVEKDNTKKSSVMSNPPSFKYNPNAYTLGIITKKKTNCPSCEQEREYTYEGPFFSTEEVEGLCPWCIQDGSAAKKFHGDFQDAHSCDPVDKKEYLDELIHKSPGYNGIQQEVWLSHCGDFCAFINYDDWKAIAPLKEELKDDLDQIKDDYNFSQKELEQYLVNDGSFQGYLFQCLHCKKHRLAVDAD